MSVFLKLNDAGKYETTELTNGLAPITDATPVEALKFDTNYVGIPSSTLDISGDVTFVLDDDVVNLEGNVHILYIDADGTGTTSFGTGFDAEDADVVTYEGDAPAEGVYAFVFTYYAAGITVKRLTYSLA